MQGDLASRGPVAGTCIAHTKIHERRIAMTRLLLVLALGLLATSCRDRAEREGTDYGKPTEATDDATFREERSSFSNEMNDRLARLDAKLRELGARGSERTREAADELRVERDRLAVKVDEIGEHAKRGWDKFATDVKNGFSDLERKVDDEFKK
jgi:hypothetical protein